MREGGDQGVVVTAGERRTVDSAVDSAVQQCVFGLMVAPFIVSGAFGEC